MLLKPLEISRQEFACPKWQNNMLIKWVQLSIPLLYLSVPYLVTISENIDLGMILVICEKSDNFTIGGLVCCSDSKITSSWGISKPLLFFTQNLFWTDVNYFVFKIYISYQLQTPINSLYCSIPMGIAFLLHSTIQWSHSLNQFPQKACSDHTHMVQSI